MATRTDESMTPAGFGGSSLVRADQTEELRGDIARTRGDMSRTVNEIEERLSPAHIKEQLASVAAGVKGDIEQKVADLKESVIGSYHETKDHLKDDLGRELRGAKHMVSDEITHARTAVHDATVGRVQHMVHDARESVTDAGTSVLGTIKANPIPAALIGVGLGWLIFGARSGSRAERTASRYRYEGNDRYNYGHAEGRDEGADDGPVVRQGQRALAAARGAAHDVGEKVSHLAHEAEHRVQELAGDARDGAVHLAGEARARGRQVVRGAGRQVRRAEQGLESTLRQNPLAIGAVAVAVGAAIALAIPHTHVEDEWMGQAKDSLMRRAEGAAGKAIHRAEEAVGQLTAAPLPAAAQADAKPHSEKNGLSNGYVSGSKSQAI